MNHVLSFTPKLLDFNKITISLSFIPGSTGFGKIIMSPLFTPIPSDFDRIKTDRADRDIVHASRRTPTGQYPSADSIGREFGASAIGTSTVWHAERRDDGDRCRGSGCRRFAPSIRIRDAVVCRRACQPALHWPPHIYRCVRARARSPPRSPRGAARCKRERAVARA